MSIGRIFGLCIYIYIRINWPLLCSYINILFYYTTTASSGWDWERKLISLLGFFACCCNGERKKAQEWSECQWGCWERRFLWPGSSSSIQDWRDPCCHSKALLGEESMEIFELCTQRFACGSCIASCCYSLQHLVLLASLLGCSRNHVLGYFCSWPWLVCIYIPKISVFPSVCLLHFCLFDVEMRSWFCFWILLTVAMEAFRKVLCWTALWDTSCIRQFLYLTTDGELFLRSL